MTLLRSLQSSIRPSFLQSKARRSMRPTAFARTALLGVSLTACRPAPVESTVDYDFVPLRNLSWYSGKRVGTAVHEMMLYHRAEDQKRLLHSEFDSVTPENSLKMNEITREYGYYDFSAADTLAEFARQNDMAMRGHTLVFVAPNDREVPEWLNLKVKNKEWGKPEVRDWYQDYIRTVVGHYRSTIHSWDVVNEAYDENGRLRDSFWKTYVGDDFVELAFQTAHEANPNAKLFYNDFDMVVSGPAHKLTNILSILTTLKDKNVPIHAIGLQSHVSVRAVNTKDEIQKRLQQIVKAGFEFEFTEVDVEVVDKMYDGEQALIYGMIMQSCLDFDACDGLTVWGLNDALWYKQRMSLGGSGSATLVDEHNRLKPAYDAIHAVLLDGYFKEEGINPPL